MIPSIFGLKGMAVAALIGCVAGSAGGYWLADTIGDAKALRLERAGLKADIAARDATIARNAKLTTDINNIAIGVSQTIADLRKAAADEGLIRNDPACDYRDDEFGRVRERIGRAARHRAGVPAATRP